MVSFPSGRKRRLIAGAFTSHQLQRYTAGFTGIPSLVRVATCGCRGALGVLAAGLPLLLASRAAAKNLQDAAKALSHTLARSRALLLIKRRSMTQQLAAQEGGKESAAGKSGSRHEGDRENRECLRRLFLCSQRGQVTKHTHSVARIPLCWSHSVMCHGLKRTCYLNFAEAGRRGPHQQVAWTRVAPPQHSA